MGKMKFIKSFDLFSKPFVFFIGENNKKKQTLLGGLLSMSVISISMVYLAYLLYLYFHNRFLPKQATVSYNESNYNKIEIEESLIQFEMIINGEKLSDFEKRKGRKYIQYSMSYEIYSEDGSSSYIDVPLKKCSVSTDMPDYFCMDFEKFQSNEKQIDQYPTKRTQKNYGLVISKCQNNDDCAESDEIENVLLSSESYFQLYTQVEEYNTTTKSFQRGYKQDYFYFDIDLVLSSTISLIKSKTTINTGLFFQQEEIKEHIVGYNKNDRYFSKNKILERQGYEGYAYLVFELNQNYNDSMVQFPMVTEVLSQFMGVFNMLLTVGILAQLLAESDIIQDVNSIFLKEYYKLTAQQLIEKQNSVLRQPPIQSKNKKTQRITQLSKEIQKADFIEKQKKVFKVGLLQRLKMIIFGVSYDIEKTFECEEFEIYQKMIWQTVKRVDIYEVYRDLIKLKMAIKLILSKDQYAALQYCGCQLNIDGKSNINNFNNIQQYKQPHIKVDIIEPIIDTKLKEVRKLNSIQDYQTESKNPDVIQFDEDYLSDLNSKVDQNENRDSQTRQQIQMTNQDQLPGIQQFSTRNKIIYPEAENNNENYNQDYQNQQKKYFFNLNYQDSELQQQQQILNHLNELDKIEEDQQIREFYLEQFVMKMEKEESSSQSTIDRNIYHSLIGQDNQQN